MAYAAQLESALCLKEIVRFASVPRRQLIVGAGINATILRCGQLAILNTEENNHFQRRLIRRIVISFTLSFVSRLKMRSQNLLMSAWLYVSYRIFIIYFIYASVSLNKGSHRGGTVHFERGHILKHSFVQTFSILQ